MIKFNCTKCNHAYRVGDEYVGKKVRCKACGTVNAVPGPEETVGCGDSVARFNGLLQELLECERKAPTLDFEAG